MSISKNIATTLTTSFLVVFAGGCETNTSNTPTANKENCTTEKIQMISDINTREKFAGECSRINTIRKTENPKNLLEYTKPKNQ